jgi:hypothetical protein
MATEWQERSLRATANEISLSVDAKCPAAFFHSPSLEKEQEHD